MATGDTLGDPAGKSFVVNGTGIPFTGVPGVRLFRPDAHQANIGSVVIEPVNGGVVPLHTPATGLMEPYLLNQARDWTIAGRTAGAIHDVFAYLTGAGGVEIAIGPQWFSPTQRTTGLTLQQGYPVNAAAFTDIRTGTAIAASAGLHVGTFRCISSFQTTFSATQCFMQTRYHQRRWYLVANDSGTSTPGNLGGFRAYGNRTTARVEWVDGVGSDVIRLDIWGEWNGQYLGCGVDATNAETFPGLLNGTNGANMFRLRGGESLRAGPGYHFAQLLEGSFTTGVTYNAGRIAADWWC